MIKFVLKLTLIVNEFKHIDYTLEETDINVLLKHFD